MFGRGPKLLLAIAAAIGVPYALTSSGLLKNGESASASAATSPAREEKSFADSIPFLSGGDDGAKSSAALADLPPAPFDSRIAGEAVQNFGEVFNFEVTPAWVMSRWSRVSTRLGDLELQGYRVPLVTGTAPDDLAGALTYYFNPEQKVERITFYGTTGDTRKLVDAITRVHALKKVTHEDSGLHLFQTKWNGEVESELQIRPSRVVRAGAPHERFAVALVLNRPAKLD